MKLSKKCFFYIFVVVLTIFVLYLFRCTVGCDQAYADAEIYASREQARNRSMIKIDSAHVIAPINLKVFGQNVLGYESGGFGLWDSKNDKPISEPLTLAKSINVSMIRFPGGCDSHRYDWKKTIARNRNSFNFGLDEFMSYANDIGAEPIFTLSYFIGTPQDAVHLIEYLNAPADKGHPWAQKRASKGFQRPYGVKYFEVGNEVYHGNHANIKQVYAGQYGRDYLNYYDAIKKVDSQIQVGAVFYTFEWNKELCDIIKNKVDFGILHIYPSPGVSKQTLMSMRPTDVFYMSLAKPVIEVERKLHDASRILKEKSGKEVPLAITEYNGGFTQNTPVLYRHCLGTALINADLVRIFMNPQNNVLMANYWNFCNEYWGMIANGFDGTYKTLYNPYYKRPNYYVFEMYHSHFGEVLIDVDVMSDSYDVSKYVTIKQRIKDFIKNGIVYGKNLISGEWVIIDCDGTKVIDIDGILTIDFISTVQFNYYHSAQAASVEPSTYYKLSGYIKTEGLNVYPGVCLEVQDGRGWVKTRSAVATESISGTRDWQYVEVIYETLPDATSVKVIARRVGEAGPLTGKAYFKDVRFEKYIPSLNTKIPYLSVNASKSSDGNKVYLMVVNKNMDNSETTSIDLNDFVPANEINAWVLNGPSVDATNEVNHDNVKITHKTIKINGNPFDFTFEPHSLTAIEIQRAN